MALTSAIHAMDISETEGSKWEKTTPVFRTFLQHPYNSLYINDDILILGVAKIYSCTLGS